MCRFESVVVLFGGPGREVAVMRVREAGYRVAAVIAPRKTTPRLDASLTALREANFVVQATDRAGLSEVLLPWGRRDLLLSIGFPYLLPQAVLDRFALCLNVHPTLLPRYRGPTSGSYILMNNESTSGVTVHLIDEGMDTGAIVHQVSVPLSRFDTIRSLQRKVYAVEPDAVVSALQRLSDPTFQPEPQDERQASTYLARRTPADSEIDPHKSLLELFDFIRACDPAQYPAFFTIEGQKVCVRLWRPDRPPDEGDDTL